MPSYRCSLCGINYPVRLNFQMCPVHRVKTAYFLNTDPDENWEWQATLIQARRVEAGRENTLPAIAVTVRTDEDGLHWISSTALIALGLHKRLHADDVIEIPDGIERNDDAPCDCLWEVMGYRDSTREYWVKPVRVPDYPPDGGY